MVTSSPPPEPAPRPAPAARRRMFPIKAPAWLGQAALVLTLFGFYSLIASRERPWVDSRIMYEVAERLVTAGRLDITTEWPPMSHRGPDGRLYAIYGLFPSLASVPGVALRELANRIQPSAASFNLVVTCHLANSLIAALTCLVFLRLARRLGAGLIAANLAAVVLGVSTMLMVYARVPFSEALQTLFFTGLAGSLATMPDTPPRRDALALGAWAGALINTKLVFGIAIVAAAVVVLLLLRRRRGTLWRFIMWTSATLLPLVALAAAYNHIRWGSVVASGYESVQSSATESLLWGTYGLLFSTGKGLFVFSPPLVLGLLGLPAFARARPRALAAIAALAVPLVVAYVRYTFWGGDWSWGPRYFTCLLPVALLPFALLLDRWWKGRQMYHLGFAAAVAAVGLFVQVLGSAFYWDHHIRIAMAAKNAWLGTPNRQGAALLNLGGPNICAACFEDMYGHDWLPPFSPISGHWWLLRHVVRGDDWKAAERDAPWHRYTSLSLNVASEYARARIDWWGLLWLVDSPARKAAGCVLLIVFAIMRLRSRNEHRRHRPMLPSQGPLGDA